MSGVRVPLPAPGLDKVQAADLGQQGGGLTLLGGCLGQAQGSPRQPKLNATFWTHLVVSRLRQLARELCNVAYTAAVSSPVASGDLPTYHTVFSGKPYSKLRRVGASPCGCPGTLVE